MASSQTHHERIVELELIVTHLQRDLDTLNGVLLEQHKEIDALRKYVAKLDDRLTRAGSQDEPFDPVAERPPHY